MHQMRFTFKIFNIWVYFAGVRQLHMVSPLDSLAGALSFGITFIQFGEMFWSSIDDDINQ